MNLRRIALTLGVLTLVGAASAQCGRGPRTSEVTLPGFLSVYYEQFRSDAQRDAAEFYGGVCVTAVGGDWTVLAERVLLSDLSAEVQLEAEHPELFFGPWRMTADTLSANERTLTLRDATVDGPDASGGARVLEVDLASGEITLRGVVLAGSAFALRGEQAVMRGASLEVQAAGVTTCIGVEPVPFEIEGLRAEADLDARSVVLTGGTLRLGSLRIPLREDLELSEEAFARLELPVKVQVVQGDPAAPRYGDGLAVRVVGIPLGEGVRLDVGATGLDTAYPLGAVALVRVEGPASGEGDAGGSGSVAGGASDANGGSAPSESFAQATAQATFGLEAGRPYLDAGVTRALTPWLDLRFGARSGAAPAQRARHEGVVALRAEAPLAAVRGRVAGEAFAAATAVTPAAVLGAIVTEPEVFGTRVGAAVEGHVASDATAAGTFALDARAEATLYPGHGVAQWGVMLAPAWRIASGPFTATLAHDARITNAASPFGVDVDRLVTRQRLTGTVRLAGVLLEQPTWTLRGRAEARAAYDFVPVNADPAGLRELRVTLRTTAEAAPWRFEVGASTELAGLVDPATGRDAYLDVDAVALRSDWPVLMAATPERPTPPTPHGTFELGVRARHGLVTSGPAAPSGLRRLELRAAVPLAFSTFEVRPFTAVDFAPTLLTGAAPMWSGWGVDVTFVTCCGSLTLGVVNDRGAWAASVAVDLERRPPSAAGVPVSGPTGIMSRSP